MKMIDFIDKPLLIKIETCYYQLSGKRFKHPYDVVDKYWWLHTTSPYVIVVHDNQSDPRFIYANLTALTVFKYTREEILQLPSRLSAPESAQEDRKRRLDELTANRIIYYYSGDRVDREGHLFHIYNGTIWQLLNKTGESWGVGAYFSSGKTSHNSTNHLPN